MLEALDQTIHVMSAQPPVTPAASVYRLLLADEIAVALTSGCSVAATGTRDADDILDLAAAALVETGVRVLQFGPPLDGASFIRQFADQWRVTGKGGQDLLPQASGERFVMLFRGAHTMAPETMQRLERMAQVWPGMQMAFAGLPSLAEMLQSDGHPTLKSRVTVFTKVAVTEESREGHPHEAEADAPVPGPRVPDQFIPTFTVPVGGVDSYAPLDLRRRRPRRTLRWVAAFAVVAALAALAAAGTGSVPALRDLAETAQTFVSSILSDRPVRAPASVPPATKLASVEPAPPSDPAPPPLWTARSLDAVSTPEQGQPPAPTQLTLLGEDRAEVQKAEPVPAPAIQDRPAEPPMPDRPSEPQGVAVSTPEPVSPPAFSPTVVDAPKVEPLREAPQPPVQPRVTAAIPAITGTTSGISPELAEAMTRRGRTMLDLGDVSAARLLLARATSAGSGSAALAMGTTFDAATLDRIGAVGILPDPVQAAAWYRVALFLGEERAQAMLDGLPTSLATVKPKDPP